MKQLVFMTLGMTLLAMLITAILWICGKDAWAAGVGVFTVFSWLAVLVVTVAAVVSWWTRSTMQMGAELALRSQESDDRRDIAEINAVRDFVGTLLRRSPMPGEQPKLPLPSQETRWLPPLGEFEEVERAD